MAVSRQLARAGVEFIAAWRQPLAATCPLHSHAGFELVLHPTGSGRTSTATGASQDFLPGTAILYGPGIAHAQRANPPGEEICLQMVPRRTLTGMPDLMHLPVCDDYLLHEVALLARVPADERHARSDELDLRATAVLLRVIALGSMTVDDVLTPVENNAARARAWLREHACEADCLRRVAAAVGIGPDHLRHCFRRVYGVGMARYVAGLRIAHAKDLLAHTGQPLREIARQCGYANERYFCRVFSAQTGSTPGRFRPLRKPGADVPS